MADVRRMAERFLAITLLSLVLAPQATEGGPGLETIDPGTLTACLPRNSGVIAGKRSTGGSGFDYRMMEEVASRLGLGLAPVWFENELEEESDPLRETYAMLSYGLCDVVPGHPRYARAVGKPPFARAHLPRWVGMPQEVEQDHQIGFVDVRPIAVSRGYMRSTIGLVHRDDTAAPAGLDDLDDRPLAFQQGTLSGAIAMTRTPPWGSPTRATFRSRSGFSVAGGDRRLSTRNRRCGGVRQLQGIQPVHAPAPCRVAAFLRNGHRGRSS